MIEIMFVIKNKDGLYLANSIYQMRWTRSLTRAQIFHTQEAAAKALVKRDGEIVPVAITEVEVVEGEEVGDAADIIG